jgi:hypothetical protein
VCVCVTFDSIGPEALEEDTSPPAQSSSSPQQQLLANLSQVLGHLTPDRREEQDIGAPLPAQSKVTILEQLREHVSHLILNLILNRGHCRRLVTAHTGDMPTLP